MGGESIFVFTNNILLFTMHKITLPLLAIFAMTSCATTYHQIATIGSSQIRVSDDGKFQYNENDLTIDYDFWSKYGKVGFVITNNTNDDVYIDLSRSFLVVNGMTFDYFQNRTYTSEQSSSHVSSSSYGGSNTIAYASGSASTIGNSTYADAVSSGTGRSFAINSTSSNTSKYGIEIKEKEGVWIPAHSSRYFCEFSLLEAPYRECGLPRDPLKKENASADFTENDTPYTFENRIMVIANGQEKHLVNSFFIQSITNLPESEAIEEYCEKDCSGNKTGEVLKIYKYRANNRFYINYEYDARSSNDRTGRRSTQTSPQTSTRTSLLTPRNESRSRFNDGPYGNY